MEKIAIKSNGVGGGVGVPTFNVLPTISPIISGIGADGAYNLVLGGNFYSIYFNLIGGQTLGLQQFKPQIAFQQASTMIRDGLIIDGNDAQMLYIYCLANTQSDLYGNTIRGIVSIIENGGVVFMSEEDFTANTTTAIDLSSWGGALNAGSSYTLRIEANENFAYTYALIEIGGFSFSLRN